MPGARTLRNRERDNNLLRVGAYAYYPLTHFPTNTCAHCGKPVCCGFMENNGVKYVQNRMVSENVAAGRLALLHRGCKKHYGGNRS